MDALQNYMKTRRSSLSMCLEEPGPNEEQLHALLELAVRVPDHGKLAPWRYIHWTQQARANMHQDLTAFLNDKPDVDEREKKQKGTDKLLHAPCVLAVVNKAPIHGKVPLWEQQLSTGALCMNTVIAANAMGFEAQWLTAWYIYDQQACQNILQLQEGEQIAGIIHIGSSIVEKKERPRPALKEVFSVRID